MESETAEAILALLKGDAGNIDTRKAFMALGEAAGCVLAFVPEAQRQQYADVLRIHVLGIASMRRDG